MPFPRKRVILSNKKPSVVLLYNGAELALEHLVLERLGSDNLYTLLCAFDIRHDFHLR